jgi:hypothetical protein
LNLERLRERATVESFLAAATSGRCEFASRLLEARPEIESDPWARLARLLQAGAELEQRFVEVAEGPLADWLEEHL